MKIMENFRHAVSAGHRPVADAVNYSIRFGEAVTPFDARCSGDQDGLAA